MDLKSKIRNEMLADYSNALERNFEIAKKFIKITDKGKIEVFNKGKLKGRDQILLYLIGKLYAKEADLSSTSSAINNEIMEELSIKEGSLFPWLKDLRDKSIIKQTKSKEGVVHHVPLNLIESILKRIDKENK